MRTGGLNEAQNRAVLREREAGTAAAEVCRQEMSERTLYARRAKHSGMQVLDAQNWKPLDGRRLEKLRAEARMDAAGKNGPCGFC